MQTLIAEFISQANLLIIPGIGAINVNDRTKNDYSLMPYLKHDDKSLKRFVAEKLQLSDENAAKKVEEWIEEVRQKATAGENYLIPGIGYLKLDTSGDFDLLKLSNEDQNNLADINETVIAEEIIQEVVIPEVAELAEKIEERLKTENESIEDIKLDEDVENTSIPEHDTNEQIVSVDTTSLNPESIEDKSSEKVIYSEEDQWNDDLDLPPLNTSIERPKKPIVEKAKFDKKKRSGLSFTLVIILSIVIAGAAPAILYFDEIKSFFVNEENNDVKTIAQEKQFEFSNDENTETEQEEEVSQPMESTENNQESTVTEVEPEVKEVVKEEPKVVAKNEIQSAEGDFLIIIGSFQNQVYANNFSQKLNNEGNSSTVIGPYNQFYLVTIGSYSTENEAKAELSSKKKSFPNAWLFKKN